MPKYRVLGANVRRPPAKGEDYKRTPADVELMLNRLIHATLYDAILPLEVAKYGPVLRRLPGYDPLIFNDPGNSDNAILVRSGIPHGPGYDIEHGPSGFWQTVRGNKTWGRAHVTVKLPGLRLVAVHMPPSVNWVNGKATGPKQRIRTYAAMLDSLGKQVEQWKRDEPDDGLLIFADWNEPHTPKGAGSPRDFAEKHGLTIFPGAHIDWSMGRNVEVKTRVIAKGREGNTSDHPLLDMTVTVKAPVTPLPGTRPPSVPPTPGETPKPKPQEAPVADNRYEIVTFRGRRVDRWTKQALEACERDLGYELTITQGSYNAGGVSASAGTHDGGGVVDLAAFEAERKVRVLRKHGFAAWHRRASQGPWREHVHAVLIGNAKLAPSAARQVTAYRKGRNGLANNGRDDGPSVVIREFPYLVKTFKPGERDVHQGDRGPDVEFVQRRVGIVADGDFGPKTKAAVQAWERQHNSTKKPPKLKVDGIVGWGTWDAMGVKRTYGPKS